MRLFALAALGALLLPGLAHAQEGFVTAGDTSVEGSEDTETEYRGRFSTSGVYYKESAPAPASAQLDQVSPNTLFFTDLRMKAEALHIEGTGWDGLGDLRVRYASNDLAARGYVGGQEFDLKEVFVVRRLGTSGDLSVGRMLIRDVDATGIDGARITYRPSERLELGAFGGLYPNPFSRTIGTDYRRGRTPFAMPVAAGAWTGYRSDRLYGSVGIAGVLPRDDKNPPVVVEQNRAFVTAQGYWRVKDGLDIYHYLSGDVIGPAGAELLNLQLGAHWRPQPRLLVETGVSHMSTYAIQIFLRDQQVFEQPDMTVAINNLALIRTGSDELRGGANYSILESRIDVNGELRIRRRSVLPYDEDVGLPMDLANLPAESQYDLQLGVRQRKAVAGVDLGASIVGIRGDRTSANFLLVRATRAFLDERLQFDLDGSYSTYADNCEFNAGVATDPTCTGTAEGQTIRAGMLTQYRHDKHWLFLGDYHFAKNAATRLLLGTRTDDPPISSNTVFFRGQYSF